MLNQEERNKLQSRFTSAENDAAEFRTRGKDIQTYLIPTRGNFNDSDPSASKSVDAQIILNSTPSIAHRALSACLSSGVTPSSMPWFEVGLADPQFDQFRPGQVWAQNVKDAMYSVLSKSNIYGCLNLIYDEASAFGIGAMFVEANYESVIRAHVFTAGEYFIGLNKDGKVNTFGHRTTMTVEQVVDEFGLNACSDRVKVAYNEKKFSQTVKICHLIEPNRNRKVGFMNSANKAFSSTYWEDGGIDQKTLRESGYDTFPVMVPRWKTRDSRAIYGISPAWEALGDIKMLQKLEHKEILAIDKAIDPPMVVDDSIDGEPLFLPGEVIRTSGGQKNNNHVTSAYDVKLDLGAIDNKSIRVEDRIGSMFFRDLIQMVSQIRTQGKTAYEVQKMYEEKLMVLGPVLENFKDELLDPLIDRVFEIMLSKGLIPPPPPELEGMELKIEYISSLAQSQRALGTAAIEQFCNFLAAFAQVYPQVLDIVDPDRVVEVMHGKMGAPAEILRDQAEVEAIREGRSQAEEKVTQEEQVGQQIAAAKTLGDAKTSPGTALNEMMNRLGIAPTPAPAAAGVA